MWNAHFANRNSLANDGPGNANGVTTDHEKAEFETARAKAIEHVASIHGEVSVSIVKGDDLEITTTIQHHYAGTREPLPEPIVEQAPVAQPTNA